ncbi:hypothetical protein SDC9_140167 [bioreactor metagenome]|uniref:Uncharacterized protein n=1 Tax=bioreactor metagenome TaxID=1076179 RepID=A0A645DUM1_9ZZZZ
MDAAAHFLGRHQRADALVEHHPLGFVVAARAAAVTHRQVLQLALAALVTDRAVERMVDQEELHHRLLRGFRLVAVGVDHHARSDGRGAGRQRLGRFLDLDQAHPAVGCDGQFLVVAEMRDVGASLGGGFHHRAAVRHLDRLAVDFDL